MRVTYSSPRTRSCRASITTRARESTEAKQIGFFGLFGAGNFGNDGSLEVMLDLVNTARPTAELLCICKMPTEVDRKFGVHSEWINWRPKSQLLEKLDRLLMYVPSEIVRVLKAVRCVRRLDALIIPGTGLLDDFTSPPWGIPYSIFRWCLLSRIVGTKVILVSIGAGPIHHPVSR